MPFFKKGTIHATSLLFPKKIRTKPFTNTDLSGALLSYFMLDLERYGQL